MKRNVVPSQYRSVSLATLDGPLTAAGLRRHYLGREVYRATRFVVTRDRNGSTAVVEVTRAPAAGDPLFAPVTDVTVLALPDDCAFVVSPETDTGIPSALAAAARKSAPGARCVVVQGRYDHVSFILDPDPVRIRVADVVPPRPAKLVDQAARVLAVAEDLPPIELVPEVVDLADLARRHPSSRYLLPCRGSGFALEEAVTSFLDQRPPRQDWTLVGCARSRGIHQWFYGDQPAAVEMCPRVLAGIGRTATAAADPDGALLLTKCCLLETANEIGGRSAVVPWGASLALVREALAELSTAADPAWAPA